MIFPTKTADPVAALCQLMPGAIATYRIGSATVAMTEDDAAAMRCAMKLSDAGRVHLVQALISRTAEGVGTYAYIAIGRPLPEKKRRMK